MTSDQTQRAVSDLRGGAAGERREQLEERMAEAFGILWAATATGINYRGVAHRLLSEETLERLLQLLDRSVDSESTTPRAT